MFMISQNTAHMFAIKQDRIDCISKYQSSDGVWYLDLHLTPTAQQSSGDTVTLLSSGKEQDIDDAFNEISELLPRAEGVINKKQAIAAVNVILGYCNTFDLDNENRDRLIREGKLPDGVFSQDEAMRQRENHREQEEDFTTVSHLANRISERLEKIAYRG